MRRRRKGERAKESESNRESERERAREREKESEGERGRERVRAGERERKEEDTEGVLHCLRRPRERTMKRNRNSVLDFQNTREVLFTKDDIVRSK